MKEYHERVLPHWHPTDRWLFITWKLAGTHPKPAPPALTEGQRFAFIDQELDKATNGPLWLADPRIADVVANTVLAGDPDLYNLSAWVIMPNHVHIILLPHAPVNKIMQKIKGASAHQANQILNRNGAFWAIEYYDHWTRSEDELNRVIRYVERNPVKAGFVDSIETWRYSSASLGRRKPAPLSLAQ